MLVCYMPIIVQRSTCDVTYAYAIICDKPSKRVMLCNVFDVFVKKE